MTPKRLSRPVLFALLAAAPLLALGWTAFGAAAARLDEAFDEANLERAQLAAALIEDHSAAELKDRTFGREGRIVAVDGRGFPLSEPDRRKALRFSASPPVRGVLAGRTGVLRYRESATGREMTAGFAPVRSGPSRGVVAVAPSEEAETALKGLRLRIGLATLLAALLAAGAAAWAGRARERELAMARELEARGRHFEAQTQELARSNADLEQFAYLASHDLQAPLRSLKNYCDLFSERAGAALNDDGRRLVDLSRQSVLRMQKMVADLLEFSRLGRDNVPPRPVSLDACLDVALADIGPELARRRGTVERAPLPTVQGREGQLTRLFQNLVSNALKYCEAAPRVRVSAELADGVCTVSVADNGIGIPEEKREAVFGLFERLHAWEKFEGSGIGLAACRKIVEHHRGRIWLEPASPHGTVVKFTLPAQI